MRNAAMLGLLPLLAQALPAQSAASTLPMGFEWIDASGYSELPLGLTAGRYQQVWPAAHVPGPTLLMLLGLAVRLDPTAATQPAFSVECEWALSTTATTPGTLSTSFIANQGPDHSVVLARRKLAFPASSPVGLRPEPFLPPLWFDRPFLFNKAAAPAGLLWEARVFAAAGSPGTGLKLDAFGPAMSLLPPKGKSAPGCIAKPGGLPLDLTAAFDAARPATLTLTLKEAPAQTPVVTFLGLDASRFGGVPLPLDLSPLGLPGCSLCVNLLVSVPGTSDVAGAWAQKFALPTAIPQPTAVPFYAQAFSPAPGVNPAGLALSNGAVALTQGAPQTTRLVSRTSPDDTTGTLEKTLGTILQIRHN